jgi:hypothetical protein
MVKFWRGCVSAALFQPYFVLEEIRFRRRRAVRVESPDPTVVASGGKEGKDLDPDPRSSLLCLWLNLL